ncbi:MAG: hypothetical protein EPO68_01540 [Planctomycetota bacterium]|nr:MAG: hypothetical protein EPO68_01540 [Planctomycetota bacterium]
MNRDFSDMLSALSAEAAEFLVVGAHALAAHGHPRATGDLDIWVRPTADNAARVWRALARFGAPVQGLSLADLSTPDVVFQIGIPPNRIDVLTSIDGVEFDVAWRNRRPVTVSGSTFAVLGRQELLANKRSTGRAKDLADVQALEADGDRPRES